MTSHFLASLPFSKSQFSFCLISLLAIPLLAFMAKADDLKNPTSDTKESGKPVAALLRTLSDPGCTPVINILWQNSLGGNGNETATSVKQTPDGGYIVAGHTKSNDQDVSGNHGNIDFWLVKLYPDGNAEWKFCYGGTHDDVANAVDLTDDGGYIMAGSSISDDGNASLSGHHGNKDMFVVKVDSKGDFQWAKSYGGTLSDVAYDIKRTSDGGYILAGYTQSRDGDLVGHKGTFLGTDKTYWIFKIDGSGNIALDPSQDKISYVYGGQYVDFAFSVQQTTDTGFVTTGYSRTAENDPCDENMYAIKFDKYLNQQWFSNLGGWNGDGANVIKQTSDGGYITIGLSHSFDCSLYSPGLPCMGHQDPYPPSYMSMPVDPSFHGKNHEMWVVKMNSCGVPDSGFGYQTGSGMQCYGGTLTENGSDLVQTCDGGYLFVGQSSSSDGNACSNSGLQDAWVVKTESQGRVSWQQSLGGSGDEKANSVIRCTDGSFVFAGYSTSNDHDLQDSPDIDGVGNHGNQDFWIVKFEPVRGISCAAPSGLTQHAENCGVTLGWTRDSCTTIYNLQYKKLNAGNWTSVNAASNPTILTVPNGKYLWQVQSQCSPTNSSAFRSGPNFRMKGSCRLNPGPAVAMEEEDGSLNEFLVYPNPANCNFTISLRLNEESAKDASIEVFDKMGRTVLTANEVISNGRLIKEISLSEAASGLYKIRIQVGTRLYEETLVIQK